MNFFQSISLHPGYPSVVTLKISAREVSPMSTRLNPSSRMLGVVGLR